METTVRKIGNSQGVTIPKPLCDELGLDVGSKVRLAVDGSCIIMTSVKTEKPQRIGIARGKKLVTEDFFDHGLDDEIAALFRGSS